MRVDQSRADEDRGSDEGTADLTGLLGNREMRAAQVRATAAIASQSRAGARR
jgi:hypothetical protein